MRDSGSSLQEQNAGIYLYPARTAPWCSTATSPTTCSACGSKKVKDMRVEGNTITGKRDYDSARRGNGIQLYNTQGAQIIGNNISFVRDALYVDDVAPRHVRGNKLHHSRYGSHTT